MKIIDKREGKWRIGIVNKDCPFLTYPNVQIACKLLETEKPEDDYCYKENCPLRIKEND